jgi:nucleoside-diphosphate-sugar epimerase
MKILVIGANGFIGNNVANTLSEKHEVFRASRNIDSNNPYRVDLLDRVSITKLLEEIKPEVIINNAGIVENSEKALQNPIFTENLLEVAAASGLAFKRIIISGSAAVYGLVASENIPVSEDAPLNANAGYGQSKLQEEKVALELGEKYNLPVTIVRIFNPIGVGMHERFLIPKIISQVKDFQVGARSDVEVSRLDSKRDYINIKDVANAIATIAENDPKEGIYNIGSGVATSNGELIELILSNSKISTRPNIIETSPSPEPLVAIQADISRLKKDLGWVPKYSIEETIKEIIDDTR